MVYYTMLQWNNFTVVGIPVDYFYTTTVIYSVRHILGYNHLFTKLPIEA